MNYRCRLQDVTGYDRQPSLGGWCRTTMPSLFFVTEPSSLVAMDILPHFEDLRWPWNALWTAAQVMAQVEDPR